jgi:hypothetical protein
MLYFCETDFKKVVDLLVSHDGVLQVIGCSDARLNQVVAVHRRGYGHGLETCGHKLQERHLGGRVLHRHAVGAQLQIRPAGVQVFCMRIIEVSEDVLFS